MDRYTIHCTSEQTKKALELGAPIPFITCYSSIGIKNAINGRNKDEYTLIDNFQQSGDYWCKVITNPTTEQMLGWLEEQGLRFMIGSKQDEQDCISCGCVIRHKDRSGVIYIKSHVSSRKDAALAAIDAALDYLAKNRK